MSKSWLGSAHAQTMTPVQLSSATYNLISHFVLHPARDDSSSSSGHSLLVSMLFESIATSERSRTAQYVEIRRSQYVDDEIP